MLRAVIRWSLDNPLLVILGTVVLVALGVYSIAETSVDAIPDLSDAQVILYTEFPGQAPQVIEDQVTYPITSKMLSVPFAKVVRGYSFFGYSFVYVIFEDGTDLYWARSRVLEYLSGLADRLPEGVTPQLGPDATGVGWAFMYVLNSEQRSLAELRSYQDWYLRFGLSEVEGVSEVASIGGFVRQYQVEVDPVRMRAYGVTLQTIKRAIQGSNIDVGGRLVEIAEREFMVRGRGYVKTIEDLQKIVLDTGPGGVPVLLEHVAHVAIGPELRRGLADWNGEGETVGGIVVVRAGADTRRTIQGVKRRLAELQEGLPDDIEVSVAYDRSTLIERSVRTLTDTLLEEMLVVSIVCIVFLLHVRSALVAILSIPLSILSALIIMRAQGLGANIMSLGGIAISIGVLVDAAIIMLENAHKHLASRPQASRREIIARSAQEVGPTLFFSLLIITLSFVPVFTLEAQEGRLFRPLAFTKTWAMAAAAVLAVTVVPVLMLVFVRGHIRSEDENPISKVLRWLYTPLLTLTLRFRWLAIFLVIAALLVTLVPYHQLGSEFMPPLWEGDVLYMPTTFPGLSITKAREILQQTDKILSSFPEVESVFGKVGRAETATDPAPLSMIETTVVLRDPSEWRTGMTREKLVQEFDRAIQIPGLTNAWTMPIKTRLDMLSTGIKTPVGIKIGGPDLELLEQLAEGVEATVKSLPGTRSAYAERVMGGSYLDFDVDREAAARFGLGVGEIQDVIRSAVGGMNVSFTVEGLERYPINVRYPRELRDNPAALQEILVPTPGGGQIPLRQVARLELREGPPGIKSEGARPNAWVYVDLDSTVDVGGWVRRAQEEVGEAIELPEGYTIYWSGQFESLARARARLLLIIPLTLGLIVLILYLHTHSLAKTLMVLCAIPVALVGSIWLLWWLGYNMSVAVAVGIIALAGLAVESTVVMLLYLDLAYEEWQERGRMSSTEHLREAVHEGAVRRVRPLTMTVVATFCSLLPILWATGTGADVMRRIAAPMVGGVMTAFLGALLLLPTIYYIWRSRSLSIPVHDEDGEAAGQG